MNKEFEIQLEKPLRILPSLISTERHFLNALIKNTDIKISPTGKKTSRVFMDITQYHNKITT